MFKARLIGLIAAAVLTMPRYVQAAAPSEGYRWVVVLDARETAPSEARVVSMSSVDFETCTGQKPSAGVMVRVISGLRSKPGCGAVRSRWLSQKGDAILVVGISDPGTTPRLGFEEVARASRIEGDLETLFALGAKIGTEKAADTTGQQPVVVSEVHVLSKTRATLAISLSVAKAERAFGATDPANAVKASIMTGPSERLFLSANVGVTSARQISYNNETKSLAPAETPKQFYVSANVSASDLYADRADNQVVRMLQSTYVGFFVEGSTRPLNQIGAIVGVRYLPLLSDLVGFDKVSPYGGILWLNDDTVDGATAGSAGTVKTHYSSPKFVAGVSLNLSEALSWVGGDSKKP